MLASKSLLTTRVRVWMKMGADGWCGINMVNGRIKRILFSTAALACWSVAVGSYWYNWPVSQWATLYYGLDPAPWLDLRPNVQYVYQPGGTARNHADLIVGLRVSVNF